MRMQRRLVANRGRFTPPESRSYVAILMLVLAGCGGSEAEGPPDRTAKVHVSPVIEQTVSARVPAVGTIVPIDVSRVAAGAPGQVIEYPAREGQFVEKDTPLATLRSVSLEIEIEEAKSLLREKEQMLAELEAGSRPEEIRQAESRMRAAEAESKLADSNAARTEKLFAQAGRAVTERDRDEAVFEAVRAREAYAEAKAQYELLVAGPRSEQIEAARAAVAAQTNIVARLQDDLKRKVVRAPFSGFLVEKSIEVGEWVTVGGPVGTIARLEEVEVQVNVEESWLHEIRTGQSVDVTIDALSGRHVTGEVREIVPRSEWSSGSRSFPVIVRVKNTTESGRPLLTEGMVARVEFRGSPRNVLLAEKDSIVRSTGRPLVFVVTDDATVRAVEVTEGMSEGKYVEIAGEIHAGDILVTEGVERLRPYDKVVVLSSATADEVNRVAEESDAPESGTNSAGG